MLSDKPATIKSVCLQHMNTAQRGGDQHSVTWGRAADEFLLHWLNSSGTDHVTQLCTVLKDQTGPYVCVLQPAVNNLTHWAHPPTRETHFSDRHVCMQWAALMGPVGEVLHPAAALDEALSASLHCGICVTKTLFFPHRMTLWCNDISCQRPLRWLRPPGITWMRPTDDYQEGQTAYCTCAWITAVPGSEVSKWVHSTYLLVSFLSRSSYPAVSPPLEPSPRYSHTKQFSRFTWNTSKTTPVKATALLIQCPCKLRLASPLLLCGRSRWKHKRRSRVRRCLK